MMAVATGNGVKTWQRRDRKAQFATWGVYLVGVAIFVYCWELISDKTIWAFVWDAPDQAADGLGRRVVDLEGLRGAPDLERLLLRHRRRR